MTYRNEYFHFKEKSRRCGVIKIVERSEWKTENPKIVSVIYRFDFVRYFSFTNTIIVIIFYVLFDEMYVDSVIWATNRFDRSLQHFGSTPYEQSSGVNSRSTNVSNCFAFSISIQSFFKFKCIKHQRNHHFCCCARVNSCRNCFEFLIIRFLMHIKMYEPRISLFASS